MNYRFRSRGGSAKGGKLIEPSNDDNLEYPTEAVMVGVAGDLKVTYVNGDVDTLPLAAGVWHPISVIKIWADDTTAENIHIAG